MRVTVIGLGLIGGSLLRALAAHGHDVTGYDLDPETRAVATAMAGAAGAPRYADPQIRPVEIKHGWHVADSIPAAVTGADVAVLAVPLPALPAVLAELTDFPGLLTDVTSVKAPVRAATTGRRYVGGHPMAGKESSSFRASDPHLFDDCAWVLCLEPGETDLADWLALAQLYTALGARVVPATADEHDRSVARISHVPHLLAAALSGLLDGRPQAGALAAGSFRDGTRVAATRVDLIAAMCGGNAGPTAEALSTVITALASYRGALTGDDPIGALAARLERPGRLRREWPPTAYELIEVDRDVDALLALGRAGGWLTDAGALIGKRPADR